MKNYHLYSLGAALVDTEIDVSDQDLSNMSVDKGLMTLVDEARQHELNQHLDGHMVHAKRASGGSACNSIYAASCFGAKTYHSCKVGNDDNGQFFLQDLKNVGIDCNSQDHGDTGITGKCLVLITPDAERSMNTYLGISESFSSAQLNTDAIAASEYLYIEGYLVTSDTGRAAAIQAKQIAQSHQVKTALSLSDPGMVKFFKEGLQQMIDNKVDLLFCNEAEALGWTNSDSLDTALEQLKKSADTFAVTLGSRGAIVFDGEQLINIEPHSIKAIDSNGAGDMFAGAFLYAITHGFSYENAGKLASLASATVVSQYGPRLEAKQHANILASII